MIKQFANTITSFLLKDNIIEKDDKVIYQFGIERFLKNLLIIIIISIIAAVLNKWIETIFIFIGFVPIRKIGGGYHSNTLLKCNLITIFMYLVNIFIINYIRDIITIKIFILLSITTIILIFIFAPVDHKNLEFNNEMMNRAKKHARISITILALLSISIIYISKSISLISLSIILGAFTASISIILGKIVRRREKNEENYTIST